jgi:hypothetical protein
MNEHFRIPRPRRLCTNTGHSSKRIRRSHTFRFGNLSQRSKFGAVSMETEKEKAVRNSLWIIGLALAVPAVASAQDIPRVEVFAGYSYGLIHGYVADESLLAPGMTGAFTFPSFGSNGWTGAVTVNATHWLGAVAEVGGLNANITRTSGGAPFTIGTREHSYLLGPRYFDRYGRWTVFAQVLFGESHAFVSVAYPEVLEPIGFVETKFAMGAGLGVDLTVYNRRRHLEGAGQEFAIRVGQADWFRTTFAGSHQDNIRLSAGLVFRF